MAAILAAILNFANEFLTQNQCRKWYCLSVYHVGFKSYANFLILAKFKMAANMAAIKTTKGPIPTRLYVERY